MFSIGQKFEVTDTSTGKYSTSSKFSGAKKLTVTKLFRTSITVRSNKNNAVFEMPLNHFTNLVQHNKLQPIETTET